MREILFRGRTVEGKEWVIGFFAAYSLIPFIGAPNSLGTMLWFSVGPETVGQFTGLTDKNGKRIFEGDIVVCRRYIGGNWIDYCVEIGFVEIKHGAFGLHRKQGYYRPFKDWLEDYEYEVIGNIHDNPELLEA